MNRDDIIRWAREAGFDNFEYMGETAPQIHRFAALVAAAERDANLQQIEIIVEAAVAAEREACAKVCEERQVFPWAENKCAAAIRARGEKCATS